MQLHSISATCKIISAAMQHFCSNLLFFCRTPSLALFSIQNCTTPANLGKIGQEMTELCYLLQIQYIAKLLLRQCSISVATSCFFAMHLSQNCSASKTAPPLQIWKRLDKKQPSYAICYKLITSRNYCCGNAAFLQQHLIFLQSTQPGIVQHPKLHHPSKFGEDWTRNDRVMPFAANNLKCGKFAAIAANSGF